MPPSQTTEANNVEPTDPAVLAAYNSLSTDTKAVKTMRASLFRALSTLNLVMGEMDKHAAQISQEDSNTLLDSHRTYLALSTVLEAQINEVQKCKATRLQRLLRSGPVVLERDLLKRVYVFEDQTQKLHGDIIKASNTNRNASHAARGNPFGDNAAIREPISEHKYPPNSSRGGQIRTEEAELRRRREQPHSKKNTLFSSLRTS